jgi:hypothetical protein
MNKFSEWLYRVSNGRIVLLFLMVFIAFIAAVLPRQSAEAEQYTGPAGSVDTSFSYTPQALLDTAEAYGQTGRAAYVRARWTFDVAWPLVYTVFLLTASSYLLKKVFSLSGGWRLLNLLPLAAALFDLVENAAASGVMLAYPDRPLIIAWVAAIATPLKWVLVGASFGLLLIGLVGWVYQVLRHSSPR